MFYKIGDKVKVKQNSLEREHYPWIPNLDGKTGIVVRIENGCFTVEMDETFLVDRPCDEHAFDYKPSKLVEEKYWAFTEENLSHE